MFVFALLSSLLVSCTAFPFVSTTKYFQVLLSPTTTCFSHNGVPLLTKGKCWQSTTRQQIVVQLAGNDFNENIQEDNESKRTTVTDPSSVISSSSTAQQQLLQQRPNTEATTFLTPTELILEQEKRDSTNAILRTSTTNKDTVVTTKSPYPLNIPSPILLATSIFLVIASTGSLFTLFGASQDSVDVTQPVTITALIAVIGFPLGIFLLYAAIVKAKAETEEDDQAFLSGK